MYICSLGYYPNAEGHYTYRKKGLPENFLFYCVDGCGWYKIGDKKYPVSTNEFFVLPSNVEHAYGCDEEIHGLFTEFISEATYCPFLTKCMW